MTATTASRTNEGSLVPRSTAAEHATTAQPAPQLSILRIKRKRTQQPTPLDALVIEQLEPSTKRRRGEATSSTSRNVEPDGPARGIFRFAETVPLDSFSTPVKTRSLRDRIQSFLAHPPPGLARSGSSASLRNAFAAAGATSDTLGRTESPGRRAQELEAPSSPASTSSRRKLPSALRAARAAAISTSSSSSSLHESLATPASPRTATASVAAGRSGRGHESSGSAASPRLAALHAEKSRLRYRVIEQRRAFFSAQAEAEEAARIERAKEDEEIRRGLRPPRVEDSRSRSKPVEEETAADEPNGIKIYEAVAELEGEAAHSARSRGSQSRQKASVPDPMQDTAMDQFGSMLNEYLSIQETISPTSSTVPHPSNFSLPAAADSSTDNSDSTTPAQLTDDEGDYVYDVYYRATEKPTARAAAAADSTSEAMTGGTTAAAGFDVSSLAGLSRIGQLAGLAEDSDDEAQLLLHEKDADPSSDEEDNADQDSNEENDYRNDYPDEDEPDSDNNKVEFRDPQRAAWSSDESDGMGGDSDGSDGMYADSDDDY